MLCMNIQIGIHIHRMRQYRTEHKLPKQIKIVKKVHNKIIRMLENL